MIKLCHSRRQLSTWPQRDIKTVGSCGQDDRGYENAIEKRNITDIRDKYVDEHDKVKELQDIIVDFITKLISSGNLTEKQAEQAAGLMVVSNNIERIADRCDEVDGLYKRSWTMDNCCRMLR